MDTDEEDDDEDWYVLCIYMYYVILFSQSVSASKVDI